MRIIACVAIVWLHTLFASNVYFQNTMTGTQTPALLDTEQKKGKWKVYDPIFRNETGRSGWKIYYGKKGTWRYSNYHIFQK